MFYVKTAAWEVHTYGRMEEEGAREELESVSLLWQTKTAG